MKISISLSIFVNFCVLYIELVNLKPVPDEGVYPEGCVHSEQNANFMKARRSLPDADSADPGYLGTEAEPQPSQDVLLHNEISHLVLADSLSGFFRGHKSRDTEQQPQTKEKSGERPANLGQDEERVQRELLSADEQVECYKQQNIEPPRNFDEPPRSLLKLKDQRPLADVFQNKQRILARPLIYKDRGTKRLYGRGEETDEITSLYSDPEKRQKLKKQKYINTEPINYNVLDKLSEPSVYKPVGVMAEFPVYDEDIDFHPDPLQGILEDKYWLDPQEQEAVIRKYIDLANNMQPPTVDYMKRDALISDHMPKSVDSKEAFRDSEAVDRECPCREIAACGDCSRGKWKKSNSSEKEGNGVLYGNYLNRKLLSVTYDNTLGEYHNENYKEKDSEDASLESYKEDYLLKREDNNVDGNPFDYHNSDEDVNENNDEETQVEGEIQSFTSRYFGRRLLSLEDVDNNKDDYREDEDPEAIEYETYKDIHSHEQDTLKIHQTDSSGEYKDGAQKTDSRRSLDLNNLDNEIPNVIQYVDPVVVTPSNSGVFASRLETEMNSNVDKPFKPNVVKEFIQMQKPFLNNRRNLEKYYVPNKFENIFQKTFFGKKPKEKPTTVDPDLEFEILNNGTLLNVSKEMNDINISITTEMPNLVQSKRRREQPVFLGFKGRRSYPVPLLKHPESKMVQGMDDSGITNVQDGNNTLNESSLTNVTLFTSMSSNIDVTSGTDSNHITGNTVNYTTDNAKGNLTSHDSTDSSTTAKPKKKIEDYDEDTFDAEIANDIVESVIAESHSGSVVGHNLGLYRRNETLSKYAKVSPESEQLLKKVTECILDHIRERLEGQSCTLLDDELLQFLKWMVLSGESYKDYLARINPELKVFKSAASTEGPAPPQNSQASIPLKQTP